MNRTLLTLLCSAAMALACTLTTPAPAQTMTALPDTTNLASDTLARLALTALREIVDPTPDDYRLTALALRVARRVDPTDTELLRLEIDAWDAAGDQKSAIAGTRKLVQLDAADHIALLRIINHNIKRLQNAEDRLAAYDRLLGPSGRTLDPAIRSRLALDAALLARERGDDDRFTELLTQATTFDVTNKNAAALYATFFLDKAVDPLMRVELLGNIVLADPVDAGALSNLAQELFTRRAFRGAERFFARARQVYEASGIALDPDALFDRILVKWMAHGDDIALESILELRNQLQTILNARARERESLGLTPKPEKTAHVPAVIELIRLAIGFAVQGTERGDRPTNPDEPEGSTYNDLAQDSADRSIRAVNEQLELVERRDPPYMELTDEQAREIILTTKLQLILVRLWSNYQIDQAQADLDELTDAPDQSGLTALAIQRFRGLIALRRGEEARANDDTEINPDELFEQAALLLTPIAPQDSAAKLGLGMLAEARGRRQEAIRQYAELAIAHSNSAIGSAARGRAEALLGSPIAQDQSAAALDRWAVNFAPWLDRFTTSPQRYMTLSAKHLNKLVSPFERQTIRITLRNISNRPLALGPNATIDSRFLLVPRVLLTGRARSRLELPEITELNQRLRLMPGESITTDLWSNRGSVGMLLDLNAHIDASIRWRLLQGYRIDDDDHYTHCWLCLTTQTDQLDRYNIINRTEIDALITHLADAQGVELLEDLLLAAVVGAARIEGLDDDQDLERRHQIASAVVERLTDSDDAGLRAYVYAIGLRGGLLQGESPLRIFARSETDPLALASLLAGSFRVEDDPLIHTLTDNRDADIRAMASILVSRAAPTEQDP